MNDCIPFETLERLHRGELPPQEAAVIGAHLRACAHCRSVLDRETEHTALRRRLEAGLRTEGLSLDDPVLGRLVDDLLATPPDGEKTTWHMASDRMSETSEPPGTSGDLGCLGPYRLLEELGRGGMGIVYRAFDEALRRMVAIKVLRPDQAEDVDRHRLVREAQLASSLQNDHVVMIHAVVDPPDGLPYLVMELVSGPTLGQKIAADSGLAPREVATWVSQVADALHCAHTAGLIHRDVKPGNILIDERTSRAKITDFGLARAQSGQSRVTREGFIAGTPTYMSPEQARGDSVLDPRSDVFSLGSTLYEALTGVTSYQGAPHLVLRQVIEEDPRPLRQLNDQIPCDLETICLKAMNREPGRRYQSADELAEDLRRWLRGEPIHARPTGSLERTWRWCWRNRRVAGLAASLIIVFVAGFLGVFWQWRRAEANAIRAEGQAFRADQMRQSAEANLEQARVNFQRARRAVDQFYTRFYEKGVLDLPGMEKVRKEVLGEMLQYYKEFLDQQHDDPSLRRELADTCLRLAMTTSMISGAADALGLFRRALRDYELLAEAAPDDTTIQNHMGTCLGWIALLEGKLGDNESARRTHLRTIDHFQSLVRRRPEDDQFRYDLSQHYGNLANHDLTKLRDGPQAREAYGKALDLQKDLVRRNPQNLEYKANLAMTYNNLSMATDDLPEQLRMIQEALELRKQLVEQAPTNNWFRRNLARTYQNLAIYQEYDNRPEDALKAMEECLRLLKQVVTEQPTVTLYQNDLATILNILGHRLADRGRNKEARDTLQQCRAIYQKLREKSPGEATYEEGLHDVEDGLAKLEKDSKPSQTAPPGSGGKPTPAGKPAGAGGA
jgi:eukaryotic-like serine/threonine-protein kinase